MGLCCRHHCARGLPHAYDWHGESFYPDSVEWNAYRCGWAAHWNAQKELRMLK